MKKIILVLLFLFSLANANAYELNLDVNQIQDIVPTQEFWHWMTLNWNYTGPSSGDPSWQTSCNFESPDKNYGITLTPSNNYTLQKSFQPTTVFEGCTPEGSDLRCYSTTTFFFKLTTNQSQNITIPVKIRGTCGVIETPSQYPVDLNYNYNFTFDSSYINLVPDINVKSFWGKKEDLPLSPGEKDAVLKLFSHDPQNKDITEIDWIYSSDCTDNFLANYGLNSSDVNSDLNLMCNNTGMQVVIAKATNEDNYSGYKAALTFFSDNNNETEFNEDYSLLMALPNINYWAKLLFSEENFDYRLSEIFSLKKTLITKNTGNGFPTETSNTITIINSIPFISVLNPDCPLTVNNGNYSSFSGEDFNIIQKNYGFYCQPGNHKLRIALTGNYSNGNPYTLIDDFNFIVPDINVNVINMKTTNKIHPTYGIVYGENGKLDLNIIINNYSPEFIKISDVNFNYIKETSTDSHRINIDLCTSTDINVFSVTETNWKINSHFECTNSHLFNVAIDLNNGITFIPGGTTVFWISAPTDKLKIDSTIMENLYTAIWNPETGYICDWKNENCEAPNASDSGSGTAGAIILPESQLTVTKGDLIRFYSTATNVSNYNLGAKTEIIITDSQGNTAATLSQEINAASFEQGGINPLTKHEFNVLFYDTEFLKENELYTVTSTVYWMPAIGFYELDSKPLNNTQITYFYVIGKNTMENLPETNLTGTIIVLLSVLFILNKTKTKL